MAWLGEQFTNITGKISDFTKEVILNDSTEVSLTDGLKDQEERIARVQPSVDELEKLTQTCQKQEAMIKDLMQQKEEMESSIVELDDQHQEVINELLTLKQHLTDENKQLKKELEVKNSDTKLRLSESSSPFLQYLYSSDQNAPSLEIINSLENDLNIFIILESLKNFRDITTSRNLNEQIIRLEKLKTFVEANGIKTDRIISLINSFIRFVDLISSNSDNCVAIAQEVQSVIFNLCDEPRKEDQDKNRNFCDKGCDSLVREMKNTCSQTDSMLSVQTCSSLVLASCQTEDMDYFGGRISESHDSSCQTENDFSEGCDIESPNSRTFEKISLCQSSLGETHSIALQTDQVCKCEELEKRLNESIVAMDTIKKKLQEKEENFLSELKKQRELTENLEKSVAIKHQAIFEKDHLIVNQTKDISSLKEELELLRKQLNALEHQQVINSESNTIMNGQNFDDRGQLLMSVSDNDKLLLQQKLKALDLEKSRLLYVLNEKSQECSNLKAEVHRLTNIVASEKQALFKLQQDNQELKQEKRTEVDVDLAKEALQNLSQLVRDKDLEIESLKEKTKSLASVVQQSSSSGEQLQSLIEEREQLLKEVSKLKTEREKIMSSYNSKDQRSRQQATEINQLKCELETSIHKTEQLQHQLGNITHQFEEKQKISLKAQDDIILLKQRIGELEQECLDVKSKYSELQNEMNSDSVIMVPRTEIESKNEELSNMKVVLQDKDDLIHEKDCLIHELSQQVKNLKMNIEQINLEMEDLKKTNSNQLAKINENECAVKTIWDEKESLSQRLSDKHSEVNLLKEMNERLNMTVKEKEFLVQSLEEKISSLSLVIRGSAESPSSPADMDQILAESKEMYTKAKSFHRERDETLLALSQCQQEKEDLKSEVQRLRTLEDHMNSELDRLRKHLLQIEESYTNEALKSETREKELRNQLAEVKRTAHLSSSAVIDASHQANVQVASLQEQIAMIAGQRDRALAQLSGLEDKVQQYAASLSNLQLVLEQMQKVHEQKMKESEEKWERRLLKLKEESMEFQKIIELKQQQLEESSQVLEAASRLSEKIDAKEEIIASLKNELSKMEKKLRSAKEEIDSFKCNSEGKVDRVVMKSLVLGYFSTPPNQKSDVVRLLARVLDFNQQEMAKAGIVVGKSAGTIEHRGLFASFFGRIPLLSHGNQQISRSNQDHEQHEDHESFARLFVKFLENESQPIVPMRLPAEEMARELTSKSKGGRHSPRNQLLAATPERGSLLIGINSTFPTLSPMPQVEHNSPTILKEILQ